MFWPSSNHRTFTGHISALAHEVHTFSHALEAIFMAHSHKYILFLLSKNMLLLTGSNVHAQTQSQTQKNS